MKKVLKFVLWLLLIVIVVVGAFLIYVQVDGIPKYEADNVDLKIDATPEMIANGARIAAVQCYVCHKGSDNKLSGRLLNELPSVFGEIHSANITQSGEHGVAKWTDGQIYALLRTGVKPGGQYLPIYMPKYPHLSEYDIKSVIAYLRSDRPEVQASEIAKVPSKPSLLVKFLTHVNPDFKKIPLSKEPVAEPDTANLVAYGKYLVTGRYDCYPCHSADFTKVNMMHPEQSAGYLGGGNKMLTPNGKEIFTANITPDATGIGDWTEEDFKSAMIVQKNKGGHSLRQPMLPYTGMTDLEVKAIWQYLLTVPKINNTVNRQWDKEL